MAIASKNNIFHSKDERYGKIDLKTLSSLVTYALYISGGKTKYIPLAKITGAAVMTNPEPFTTRIDHKKVPDTYSVAKALKNAANETSPYLRGNCVEGWKLTARGVRFAIKMQRSLHGDL